MEINNDKVLQWSSIAALAVSLVAGVFLNTKGVDIETVFFQVLELAGKLWILCMLVLIIPLGGAYFIDVIIAMYNKQKLGRIGKRAAGAHLLILLAGTTLSVCIGLAVMEIIGDDLPFLSVASTIDFSDGRAIPEGALGMLIYYVILAQLKVGQAVFYVIITSVVASVIIVKFFNSSAEGIRVKASHVAAGSMRVLHWLLLVMPLAVFSLVLPMTASLGFTVAGSAVLFIILDCGLLLAFLGMLYTVVHFWGAHDFRTFLTGMISPQIVAVSTRSSLATMPSLIDSSEKHFGVPDEVSGSVIPLFVTAFRPNIAVSGPLIYIFLVYIYRLDFDVGVFIVLLLFLVLISFTSPGIPSGSKMVTMSLYLAAGIPMEGIVLVQSVDDIPDIFKTVVNTTEVMVVTSVIANGADWDTAPAVHRKPDLAS